MTEFRNETARWATPDEVAAVRKNPIVEAGKRLGEAHFQSARFAALDRAIDAGRMLGVAENTTESIVARAEAFFVFAQGPAPAPATDLSTTKAA